MNHIPSDAGYKMFILFFFHPFFGSSLCLCTRYARRVFNEIPYRIPTHLANDNTLTLLAIAEVNWSREFMAKTKTRITEKKKPLRIHIHSFIT